MRTPLLMQLVRVDEAILDELITIAMTDADPDDVTPPLGDGWTSDRVAWLRAYHRERRTGFAGGGDEETSAIRFDGRVVGASRLHRANPDDAAELECGIWLVKSARGLGISRTVFRLAAERARQAGASRLVARTTAGNAAALRLLQRANAAIQPGPGGAVFASIELTDTSLGSPES